MSQDRNGARRALKCTHDPKSDKSCLSKKWKGGAELPDTRGSIPGASGPRTYPQNELSVFDKS